MKFNRSMALILMTSCAAAVFAWSHAESRVRKTVESASHPLVRDKDASLSLVGTIGAAVTTPIISRNWNLVVPLKAWVRRGEVIGAEESPAAPAEMDSARQELEEARSAEERAEEEVRQAEEELNAMQTQTSNMYTQEAQAETAEVDAEREFERRDALLRSGLTARFDYDTAVAARDSAEEAVDSISSKLAETSVETDVLEAKAQSAQADLREATTRLNGAEVVFEQMQAGSPHELIAAPADGILIASRQPEGVGYEVASDARHLYAYATLRPADLMAVRIGQEALVILDAKPAITLSAKVSAISEDPIDSSEGDLYQVTFIVDNPGDISLPGAAMHVHMMRFAR